MGRKRKEGKPLGNIGKIRSDIVDTIKEEAKRRDITKTDVVGERLGEIYAKSPLESRIPLFTNGEKEIRDIIERYESNQDEQLRITELKALLHEINNRRSGKRVFYQHRQEGKKNLPDFIKNILDEKPTEKILYVTLSIIQKMFSEVKNDPKEREHLGKDIFPRLKIILENKQTKTEILEEAINGLRAMIDEYDNLIIMKTQDGKRIIDVLQYMFDLQKRCFLWPEYKPFLERDTSRWKVLFVKDRSPKDLMRLRKLIHENIDKAPDKLKEIYRNMRKGIDYRLHYELAYRGKTHDIYGICPFCGKEFRSSIPKPTFSLGNH